jgi:hypothetical protein
VNPSFAGNWEVPAFGVISKYWFKTSIVEGDEGNNIGSVEFANNQGTCVDLELVDFVNENEIVFKYNDNFDVTATFSACVITLSPSSLAFTFTGTSTDPFFCTGVLN